jgi:hypothetical protein
MIRGTAANPADPATCVATRPARCRPKNGTDYSSRMQAPGENFRATADETRVTSSPTAWLPTGECAMYK